MAEAMIAATDSLLPLQGAIIQAESWTRYLNGRRPELSGRPAEEIAASLESMVWFGVKLGEMLPLHWRIAFDSLFRAGNGPWITHQRLETARQQVHLLFQKALEALGVTLQIAETLQHLTGRKPAGLGRLYEVTEEARQLEETVFRDWPSFADPLSPANLATSLPVDESLAEALGIPVGEAKQRMDARRRELKAGHE